MTNRRNFLKLSALTSLPLISNQAFAKRPDFDETYDVVVVGSGFAGLWAAISANQERAGKVVIFEKGPSSYLGASGICGGSANAAEPKLKRMQVTKMIKPYSKKRSCGAETMKTFEN